MRRWALTIALSALIVAGAVVTLLMLAGKAGLNAQFLVGGVMTLVGFVWLWPASAAAARSAVLPAWVLAVSIVLVLAFGGGAVVLGAAFLLPDGSGLRTAISIVGAIPLGLAMLGFPSWWLVVASTAH